MGKIITVVLGLGLTAAAAWYALGGTMGRGDPSAPKRQLDNVRQAADRIESDAQKRVEGLESKMQQVAE
jgi:hypothetical protein